MLSSPSISPVHETIISPKIEPFELNVDRYEKWFEIHAKVYQSELKAIRQVLPKFSKGLEIGVGTGRFSKPFNIQNGIEPARSALKLASCRGVESVQAVGEALPYPNESFDLVLIVTPSCFFSDVRLALREAFRVLSGGSIVIGFVDKGSSLGKMYQEKREESPFYGSADFYSTSEVKEFLNSSGFANPTFVQTIFKTLEEIRRVEPVEEGYGKGSFVVVRATRPP